MAEKMSMEPSVPVINRRAGINIGGIGGGISSGVGANQPTYPGAAPVGGGVPGGPMSMGGVPGGAMSMGGVPGGAMGYGGIMGGGVVGSSSSGAGTGGAAAPPRTGTGTGLGSGGGAGGALTNVAATSPNIQKQIERYAERLSADPTQRAIDRSNRAIADSAALMAADQKANMARRGVMGTGVGDAFLQRRVFDPAQRQAAEAATQIALGRERDLDALVLQGTGLMRTPDELAIQRQNLALQQAQLQDAAEARRAGMAQQQQQQAMAQWLALAQMYGGGGAPRL